MSADPLFALRFQTRTNLEYYTIRKARLERQVFLLKLVPLLFSSAAIAGVLPLLGDWCAKGAAVLSAVLGVISIAGRPDEALRNLAPIHARYADLNAVLEQIDDGAAEPDSVKLEKAKADWVLLQSDELKVDRRDDDIMGRAQDLADHAFRVERAAALTWRGWVRSGLFWII